MNRLLSGPVLAILCVLTAAGLVIGLGNAFGWWAVWMP